MSKSIRNLRVSVPSTDNLVQYLEGLPGVELVLWDMDKEAPHSQIDLVVPPNLEGPEVLTRLSGVDVGLVQWQSIGTNGVADYLPAGIPFANAASVHEKATAELALSLALASQRGLDLFINQQAKKTWAWQDEFLPGLLDKKVVVVGYGGVGQEIVKFVQMFTPNIDIVARTARTVESDAGEQVQVHAFGDLPSIIPGADVIFLAVPLTSETEGLFGRESFAAMKEGSLLVNVARGPVVDTDALVAALQSNRIRAALDVTDPEPLPDGHALWDCEGLIISPHVGADIDTMPRRMAAVIAKQIVRLQKGQDALNLVTLH